MTGGFVRRENLTRINNVESVWASHVNASSPISLCSVVTEKHGAGDGWWRGQSLAGKDSSMEEGHRRWPSMTAMARQTRREARSGSMTSSSPHPSLPSPVLPPQPHGTGAGLAAHRRQRPVSSSLRSRLSSSSLHDPIRERRLYRPHQLLHPHRRRGGWWWWLLQRGAKKAL